MPLHLLHKNSIVRLISALVGVLVLAACVMQQMVYPTPPALLHSGTEIQLADVDVLDVSPEMDEFLERYILKYADPKTRLYLLMNSVMPNGVLGFDYDESLTLTASQAFDSRAGNCIGFANMMVALARKAGLKADYQEVIRQPEWSTQEDTVLLIKHINVLIYSPGYTYVVDVSGIKLSQNMRRRVISDDYAKALHLNNIGAIALLENELPVAHAYLSMAIDTESQITDPWVNLGVVFSRNEQLHDAETALNRALEIDASEYSAMSNLYEVYLAQEDIASAQGLEEKVEKYRRNNPYYLLRLSDEAVEQDRLEESMSLLKSAINKNKNDHLLHFALAKTQYLYGQIAAAEGSLIRARELAPEDLILYYAQPLGKLLAEE